MHTDVMGVGFDSFTLSEAVDRALELLGTDGADMVVTPNAEIVYEAMRDNALMQLLSGADMVLPDGIGIVYGARILGAPIKERVPGIDFAGALMERLPPELGLFLFGGKPGVAEAAAVRLREKYPQLNICGVNDGYFTDDGPIIDRINASGARLLFVCLGAPKQERWMAENAHRLTGVRLMAGLGGSLDGFAGNVRRAPRWMQRLGLEWLYRLIKEPSRIGRMMRLPKFLFAVIGRRLSGKNKRGG